MNKKISGITIAVASWCCVASAVIASDKAPTAVQAEFASFISKFDAALEANDPAAVAAMSKLPFQGDVAISNADQFAAAIYKEDFSANSRSCIRRGHAVYSRDQDKNDTYSIICGQTIYTFTRTPSGFLFTDVDLND
jgi:hypothetical protein